ncbi:MAG: D-sedoheptulose 7-phosphate isomerase [Candidatus Thermoplasmatota archaeon]
MGDKIENIYGQFRASAELKLGIKKRDIEAIEKCASTIVKAYKKGKKLVVFGNGGSAADAQHIVCELIGKFMKNRRGLNAIALTTNSSVITAIANDYDFETVFSRQVEALVKKGDVVIGISTSGESRNVLKGIEKAREKGAITIGLTGREGNKLGKIVDIAFFVPSNETPRIQEMHITALHIICSIVEEELFEKK